jgi:hypothetical protein
MAIQSEDDVEANESVPLVPSPKNDNAAVSKRSAGSTTDRSGNDGRDKKVKKRLRKKKREATDSPLIKYGSLVLLVAQLVGLVMLMRYSRTHTNGKDLYLSSTAVFCMEVMKFIVCNFVVFLQGNASPKTWAQDMYKHTWMAPFEIAKVSVPSFLYVVQNNLLYLALTNLDAATYQVCYQLKILTTALFSATMLQVGGVCGDCSGHFHKVLGCNIDYEWKCL